jgi:D-arginine dehydrogenase
MFIASTDQVARLDALASLSDVAAVTQRLSSEEAKERCDVLRPDYVAAALLEPDSFELDVHGLQQGYLRSFKEHGGVLRTGSAVHSIAHSNEFWTVETGDGRFLARTVINAAGAWADQVATLAGVQPLGIRPYRRTAILVDAPPEVEIDTWPMVVDIDESFYFKPDAGLLLLSPADEIPEEACDAQAEELEIAIAIDRVESASTLRFRSVRHKWAGLRSFAPDRNPVVGYSREASGFFWLAGQGGYGIQTAPALSRLAAAAVLHEEVPSDITEAGITHGDFSPHRFV